MCVCEEIYREREKKKIVWFNHSNNKKRKKGDYDWHLLKNV